MAIQRGSSSFGESSPRSHSSVLDVTHMDTQRSVGKDQASMLQVYLVKRAREKRKCSSFLEKN